MHALTNWSFDPGIVAGIAAAALLYWRGRRRLTDLRRGGPSTWYRTLSFYLGLAVLAVALQSDIDILGATSFAFHMIQHLLVIMVAAPLILLGDPVVTVMRGVPLSLRRTVLQAGSRRPWFHTAIALFGRLNTPIPAAVLFLADLYFWHWNVMFNLTLQNDVAHATEHLSFLGTALLLWAQVIDTRVLHPTLSYLQRAVYVVLVGASGNLLAMYFVFSTVPLYHYARLLHHPFGLSALADQQYAGVIMWVPVLLLFAGAFGVLVYLGLGEDARTAHLQSTSMSTYRLLPRQPGNLGGRNG